MLSSPYLNKNSVVPCNVLLTLKDNFKDYVYLFLFIGITPKVCSADLTFNTMILQSPERSFLLKFSALEIYNETVVDLLNREPGSLRLLDDPEVYARK